MTTPRKWPWWMTFALVLLVAIVMSIAYGGWTWDWNQLVAATNGWTWDWVSLFNGGS